MQSRSAKTFSLTLQVIDDIIFYALALMLIILPLIYTTAVFDIFGALKILFLRLTSTLLLVLISLKLITGDLRLPDKKYLIPLLVLLLSLVVSLTISPLRFLSFIGLRRRYLGYSTYLLMFFNFLAVSQIKWDEGKLKRLLSFGLMAAIIVSLIGLAEILGSTFPYNLKQQFPGSAYTTFGNPNYAGVYLSMMLPIAISLSIATKKYVRVFYGVTAAIVALALLATKSTGGVAAGVITIILFIFLTNRDKVHRHFSRYIPLLAALVIAATIFILFAFGPERQSFVSRLRAWRGVAVMTLDNPVFGVGPEMIRYRLPQYLLPLRGYNNQIFEDAHNLFLNIAGNFGLPALLAFLFLIGLIIHKSSTLSKQSGSVDYLTLGMNLSVIAYLASEMVNPDDIVPLTIFWLILAILISRISNPYLVRRVSPLVSTAAILSTTLIFLVAGFFGYRYFMAERAILLAEKSQTVSQANRYYQLAQNLNPNYDWYYARQAERLLPIVSEPYDFTTNLVLKKLGDAIIITPQEYVNYALLARAYQQIGDRTGNQDFYDKSLSFYRESLSRNPLALYAIAQTAIIYKKTGKKALSQAWTIKYTSLASETQISDFRKELTQ